MPIIFIFNVQEEKYEKLEPFIADLRKAIAKSDDRRKIRKRKIPYFFPEEHIDIAGSTNGLVIIIGGLFVNPGINNEKLTTLFQKVHSLLIDYFPSREVNECFIHTNILKVCKLDMQEFELSEN